jgi:hypothetical protein
MSVTKVPLTMIFLIIYSVILETGLRDPEREPYRTLDTYRRVDKGRQNTPFFGMYCVSNSLGTLIPLTFLILDGLVRVGDSVKVLYCGDHYFIKE